MHTTSTTFPLQLATTLHRCCRVVLQRIRMGTSAEQNAPPIEKGSWEGAKGDYARKMVWE